MLLLAFFEGEIPLKHQARCHSVDGFLAFLRALAVAEQNVVRIDGRAPLVPERDGKRRGLAQQLCKSLGFFCAGAARAVHVERVTEHQLAYFVFRDERQQLFDDGLGAVGGDDGRKACERQRAVRDATPVCASP